MSSLQEKHIDLGATFATIAGKEIPDHYGDIGAEYRAVRNSAGVFDRSSRGKVRAVGTDCVRFLHGMVTNTVEGLEEGEGNHASVTSAQGQTLLDVWVHRLADCVWLETEPGCAMRLVETLDRYLIADDVTLSDETDDWAILGVQGPEALAVAGRVVGDIPVDLAVHHTVERTLNDNSIWITGRFFSPEGGCDLLIEQKHAGSLFDALVDAGATPTGWQVQEILRVEAGLARYGADVDESVVPLEAGLSHTVDFDKGCYIGQEVIAKMHFRGQPRRYLVGLSLESDLPQGDTITVDGKAIGRVTSCVKSVALDKVIALAVLRRGYHEPGQWVLLEDQAEAQVVDLPFVGK